MFHQISDLLEGALASDHDLVQTVRQLLEGEDMAQGRREPLSPSRESW